MAKDDRRAGGDRRERARRRGLARSQAAAHRVRRGAAAARGRAGLRGARPGRRRGRAAAAVDRRALQEQGRRARRREPPHPGARVHDAGDAARSAARALPYQVQDLLPVPASQAVLDFYPARRSRAIRSPACSSPPSSENIEQIIATLVEGEAARAGGRPRPRSGSRASQRRSRTPTRRSRPSASATTRPRSSSRAAASRSSSACCRSTCRPRPSQRHADADRVADRAGARVRRRRATHAYARRDARGGVRPASSDLAARLRSTLAFFASRPERDAARRRCSSPAPASRSRACMPALDGGDRHARSRVVTVADVIGVSGAAAGRRVALNLVGTVGIALGEVR